MTPTTSFVPTLRFSRLSGPRCGAALPPPEPVEGSSPTSRPNTAVTRSKVGAKRLSKRLSSSQDIHFRHLRQRTSTIGGLPAASREENERIIKEPSPRPRSPLRFQQEEDHSAAEQHICSPSFFAAPRGKDDGREPTPCSRRSSLIGAGGGVHHASPSSSSAGFFPTSRGGSSGPTPASGILVSPFSEQSNKTQTLPHQNVLRRKKIVSAFDPLSLPAPLRKRERTSKSFPIIIISITVLQE